MKNKTIIGCFFAVGLAGMLMTVLVVAGGYYLSENFQLGDRIEEALVQQVIGDLADLGIESPEIGVRHGDGVFSKRVFWEHERLSVPTDMMLIAEEGDDARTLLVLDPYRAFQTDLDSGVVSSVDITNDPGNHHFVDYDADGTYEFFDDGRYGDYVV